MVRELDKHAKNEIVEAIRRAEESTTGEIRVHVQSRCGEDPMKDARRVFRRLRMHKTKHKNAVLIFVATLNRRFAIIGDEGIHQKVGEDFWNGARDAMTDYFSKGKLAGGITAGVRCAGQELKKHFPIKTDEKNELSDTVSEG